MRLRIRKLSNDKWIAEVKRFFGWRLIHIDTLRQGDIAREMNLSFMEYVLTETSNYEHHIRFSEGSVNTEEDACDRAKKFASKHGLSKRDHCIEGDTGL